MQYIWIDKSLTNEDFEYTINRCYTSYMQQTNDVLFNLLDSHDTKRLRSDVKNLDEYYSNTAFQWHFDTKNKTIRQERKMLSALYEASDYVIDTSHLTAQGLLQELKERLGLTYFFISHNLNVVYQVSDRVGVMYLGKMVEIAAYDQLYAKRYHPYTEALLSAIPQVDATDRRERIRLTGAK